MFITGCHLEQFNCAIHPLDSADKMLSAAVRSFSDVVNSDVNTL